VFLIKLHPTTLILAWIGFALALSAFGLNAMAVASVVVAGLMAINGVARCWQLVRRTRILILALLLVYLFATPGVPLFAGWDRAYPTWEGLQAGSIQAWRLLLLVSALAVLLSYLSRQQLLAGIYVLLLPFKPLGVPVAKFAVRLCLTLQYAESASPAESLSARWDSALSITQDQISHLQLDIPNFGLQDFVFACIYSVILGAALWLG